MRLLTSYHPPADLDAALSSAILRRVGAGELGPTLRIFVPGRIVAFGSRDRTRRGYGAAVRAVRAAGFEATERLAGGKAAVFHEGTVAFAIATPEPDPKSAIEARFEAVTGVILDAIGRLGLQGQVGETPGEYCPGRFSISVDGRKVMGVGQRLVTGAAHVGGVLVVDSPDLVNAALIPAYEALEYEWSTEATGSLSDRGSIGVEAAAAALIGAFEAAGHHLEPAETDEPTLELAVGLAAKHLAR